MIKKFILPLLALPFYSAADGFSTAEILNEKYNSTGEDCSATSPIECSGVIIRSAESNSLTWIPTETQQKNKTMAASFIRRDIGSNKIWAHQYIGYGIIYGNPIDQSSLSKPEGLCFFPANAGSDTRENRGCGKHFREANNEDLSGCDDMGIKTAEEWLLLEISERCSFNVHDKEQSEQAISAQIKYNELMHTVMWNEIVIDTDTDTWDAALDKKPITALFYHKGYSGDHPFTERGGLDGAQYEQVKFHEETGKFIPILSISEENERGNVFSYSPSDQKIEDE